MIKKFILMAKKENFEKKMLDFISYILNCKDTNEIMESFNIKRNELSILMKIVDIRIKIIKFDKEDWINDIEADINNFRLSKKPEPREILTKLLEYIEICKDFNFLINIKKILDKISIKMKVSIFETMSDEEQEEYFNESFKSEQKKENGIVLNPFFQ